MINEHIKEQVRAVLDKYDKHFSAKGILANLEAWQRNKGQLVDLLRRHPNWNEEAHAILFEVTHSREIDRSTVNSYKFDLIRLIRDMDLSEGDQEQFIHSLEAVACTYSKTLPGSETASVIKQKCGISCAVGQKTSRIINAICKRYGLDQHLEYNARFAKLADALNPLQIKRTAILSVHPCDYLEMSNRQNSWSSCHCLDEGEYHAGTLSYMNDGYSMIFYTVDDDVTEDFYQAPKRTRQVFCYGDGILLQSRLYPHTDDDEARAMYRNIVQRAIADCLQLPNLWTLRKEHDEVLHRVSTHEDARHYSDYIYKGYKPTISLLKGIDIGEYSSIPVGHTAYCLDCAEIITETNTLYCDCCSDDGYVTCFDCGARIHEDSAQYIDGEYYCDRCCSYCDDCESYVVGETTRVVDQSGHASYVCQSCLAEQYRYCDGCGRYHYEENGDDTQDGFRCHKCLQEDYVPCDQCGEYLRYDNAVELDECCYCGSCAKSVLAEMECQIPA